MRLDVYPAIHDFLRPQHVSCGQTGADRATRRLGTTAAPGAAPLNVWIGHARHGVRALKAFGPEHDSGAGPKLCHAGSGAGDAPSGFIIVAEHETLRPQTPKLFA